MEANPREGFPSAIKSSASSSIILRTPGTMIEMKCSRAIAKLVN